MQRTRRSYLLACLVVGGCIVSADRVTATCSVSSACTTAGGAYNSSTDACVFIASTAGNNPLVIPDDCTYVTIKAWGAGGQADGKTAFGGLPQACGTKGYGGGGGYARLDIKIPVGASRTYGSKLQLNVAQNGSPDSNGSNSAQSTWVKWDYPVAPATGPIILVAGSGGTGGCRCLSSPPDNPGCTFQTAISPSYGGGGGGLAGISFPGIVSAGGGGSAQHHGIGGRASAGISGGIAGDGGDPTPLSGRPGYSATANGGAGAPTWIGPGGGNGFHGGGGSASANSGSYQYRPGSGGGGSCAGWALSGGGDTSQRCYNETDSAAGSVVASYLEYGNMGPEGADNGPLPGRTSDPDYDLTSAAGRGGHYKAVNDGDADGSPGRIVVRWSSTAPAVLSLSHRELQFGAVQNATHSSPLHYVTPAQTIEVTAPSGTSWTVNNPNHYITVSPTGGTIGSTGKASFTVTAAWNAALPTSGSAAPVTLTVTDTAAQNSPQTVTVNVQVSADGTSVAPFGYFDSPVRGATSQQGAIGITGWALDDIAVDKVQICRDRNGNESFTPCPRDSSKVYIGDATIVSGARPDIEDIYGSYPRAYRSAWGYSLLTNLLPPVVPPGGYNTSYTLRAWAVDLEGNVTQLRQNGDCPTQQPPNSCSDIFFTANNETAQIPFGTIDTPTQGQTVSGTTYYNWGWALSPHSTIPTNGSTITLFIDDIPRTGAQYNRLYNLGRCDVWLQFQGYNNTGSCGTCPLNTPPGTCGQVTQCQTCPTGALGRFTIDTTTLTNGLHTIAWRVCDMQIPALCDGIGSRYFTVQN